MREFLRGNQNFTVNLPRHWLVFTQMSINRQCGCFRPWNRGKSIGNTRFAPHAGTAWRLVTTEKWADVHENKFMGEGTPVDAKTW